MYSVYPIGAEISKGGGDVMRVTCHRMPVLSPPPQATA